jgi:uncharacterized low-complexity protein
MTRRWGWGIALVAVFTMGAVAASLATTSRSKHLSAHITRVGKVMHATKSAAGKAGTKVTTIESDTLTIQPGAVDGANGTCPSKAKHPVSGYWGTDELNRDGDLVGARSTPTGSGGRTWEVAVKNVSAAPITAYVGTVCIK